MPDITPITSLEQFHTIVSSPRVALVYFWAYWALPCTPMTPLVAAHATARAPGIDFYRVDIDATPDIARAADGRTIPAFYVYSRGRKVGEVVGAAPDALEKLVREATATAGPIGRPIR
ncbi:thioredoxin-like protein [Gloeopeniophorella convolvens]|nr:thioredoxin-like protein [Gloeopeniophorella convolvens]